MRNCRCHKNFNTKIIIYNLFCYSCRFSKYVILYFKMVKIKFVKYNLIVRTYIIDTYELKEKI